MKFIKKSIFVLGAMVLTLGLFSFQPVNFNELDMGTTITYHSNLDFKTQNAQESAKIVANLVNGAKKAAGKAFALVSEVFRVQRMYLENGSDTIDKLGLSQNTNYRLNKL